MNNALEMSRKTPAELEAMCLKEAKKTLGSTEILAIKIKQCERPYNGPNWAIAEIIPRQTDIIEKEIRSKLAHLWGTYALVTF